MTGKQQRKSFYPKVDNVGLKLDKSILYLKESVAIVVYRTAAGGGGGASVSGVWSIRPLNMVLVDQGNIINSLASDRVNLGAGKYWISAIGAFYRTNATTMKLYNVNNSVYIEPSAPPIYNAEPNNVGAMCALDVYVSITGSKDFELRYYCTGAYAEGLGKIVDTGEYNYHTTMLIRKLKS